MAKPIIALIGLGVTGASLGLALQQTPGNFEIVGHDKDPDATQQARKLGAVQRTTWNLHNACEGASMIVLSTPLSELRELFGHLAEDTQPETLVFTAVNVMQPAIALGAELLPKRTHFVVGHPILTGIGGPLTMRADLFQEGTFCMAPGVDAQPEAVQLASDLVERAGAKPLFVDAAEHDGLIAGVEQLPQVMAAALMQMNAASAGWREGRRLAGRQFAQSSELGHNARKLFSTWHSNRSHLVQRIEQLQHELDVWHQLLSNGDEQSEQALMSALEQVVNERLSWEGQAMLKQWEQAPPNERPDARGLFQQMLFGNFMGRRTGGSNKT
jgi:prephenate dehydrogenase